ncbi:MAG TPA: hypothetical protein VJZ93_00875 [Candidatus Nanoarchaeia archaeon]|nr:hypothetical protein [Candidatus Nanoarchaeia archaeon]
MKISWQKKEKIFEQILSLLYSSSPRPLFTSNIAVEIARDEEFVKNLLSELKSKNLVVGINRNPKGILYSRRMRWKLNDKVYNTYKSMAS